MGKQWENADLLETRQIIYHSKGIDESYPKMYFLFNLSHYVKSYGHFCQILAFFNDDISPFITEQLRGRPFFIFVLDAKISKLTLCQV